MSANSSKQGISISIPGYNTFKINHLVFDFNGTIAFNGIVKKEAIEKISLLSSLLNIHVITADTFESVQEQLSKYNVNIVIIDKQNQDLHKERFVSNLGCDEVIAFGNGRNDALMLKKAAIGIAIMMEEGCSVFAINNCDVVSRNIIEALDMVINHKILIATLRN